MKKKAIIVDDEPHARFRIKHLLKNHPEILKIGEARNGAEAIELIETSNPDIVFLDIQMPDMDGFEVVKNISKKKNQPHIIFTTAYDEYALKAFEVHAIDYLLKPIDEDRFNETIELLIDKDSNKRWFSKELLNYFDTIEEKKKDQFSISVEHRSKNLTIYPEEIISIHSDGNYSNINLAHTNLLYRSTLSELEEKLSSYPFLRIHRKVIVNTRNISKVEYKGNNEYLVKLTSGEEIRSGRSYKEPVKKYLEINSDLNNR